LSHRAINGLDGKLGNCAALEPYGPEHATSTIHPRFPSGLQFTSRLQRAPDRALSNPIRNRN